MKQQSGQSPFGDSPDPSLARSRRNRFGWAQFSLGRLLLVLTVTTTAAAPLAYLARAMRGSRHSHFVFILLCLAAPTLLLIVVSLVYFLVHWFDRK